MKYLHLYSWSPRNVAGGMETVINTTALAQADKGHTVFIAGRIFGRSKKTIQHIEKKVTYIEIERSVRRRPGTLNIGIEGYILLLAEIFYTILLLGPVAFGVIKKQKISIVFFYGIHLLPLSIFFRLFGVKTVLVFEAIQRNPYPSPLSMTQFFRLIKYRCFDAVFTTVSTFHAADGKIPNEKLLREYAGDSAKIFCFPWGIDSNAITKIKSYQKFQKYKDENYKIIVCPRRLVEEKGVRYLLEAMPSILERFPKTLCVFTSYGILKSDLLKRARELQIEKDVVFTGPVPYKNVLQVIKSADVLVAPSTGEELFGMVFLEAYSLKTPIVTTKFGGIPSVVKNGKTGLLVEPKNVAALANAIIQLLSKKDLAAKLTKNGQKLVYEKFQLRDTIENIDSYVKKILRN